ncbi:MAG TPA: hypothetical protein QGH10_05425, partial [Armatimonadota bacterium]|nr:hypothetical protein [Armatimonadota bacterium]
SRLIPAGIVAGVVLTGAVIGMSAHSQRGQGIPADRNGITAVGELAPDFTLTTIDKTADVTLSSYIGERPVALIFGSYT